MFGFKTATGKTIENKNQLLQVKHSELVILSSTQAKQWGVASVRTIKETGTIRAGVLKEQLARMSTAASDQESSDRRAVATLHQNCFVGSDE